jgi:hypothetical protein
MNNAPSYDPLYRQTLLACHIACIGFLCLFGYIYLHPMLHSRRLTWLPLDRWLYAHRRLWLLQKIYVLPLLAAGSGLLGRFLAYMEQAGSRASVFNTGAESFPQEEHRLSNPYSVHLPMEYAFRGRWRKGWINLLQPFRGLLIMGSPGSGKSYYVIRPLLEQQIRKGFTLFVYDFKFDDLSRLVYNTLCTYPKAYAVKPSFHLVHFDDLARSHRCNPLDPSTLEDLAEAEECARTILLGLNRDWIRRQGDFFVESAINFVTALIWFLRRYHGGTFCTLPHVIELMQTPYDQLFSLLRTEPEIEFLINPFVSAYLAGVMPQLEGQIAGAKISLARLSAPHLYYILSANDFSLDINDPRAPKIVCMGNTPKKQQVYGAVLSLYVSRLVRLVNRRGGLPCSLVFDEFPTLYFNGMDSLLATARSNRVAATIAVQDMTQLRKEYGRDQADVLLNITGNVISGQVSGDTARQLSERFGKILQERRSTHTGSRDSSSTTSQHLEAALPPSRIASLSAGELVGLLADAPDQRLPLKMFHGRIRQRHPIIADHPLTRELPLLPNPPDAAAVAENYRRIKAEVQEIVQTCIARLLNEPGLKHLVVRRK